MLHYADILELRSRACPEILTIENIFWQSVLHLNLFFQSNPITLTSRNCPLCIDASFVYFMSNTNVTYYKNHVKPYWQLSSQHSSWPPCIPRDEGVLHNQCPNWQYRPGIRTRHHCSKPWDLQSHLDNCLCLSLQHIACCLLSWMDILTWTRWVYLSYYIKLYMW